MKHQSLNVAFEMQICVTFNDIVGQISAGSIKRKLISQS